MATAAETATARITAYKMIGRVNALIVVSPGISGKCVGCGPRPLISHRPQVITIQNAEVISQASACDQACTVTRLRWNRVGSPRATMNHTWSRTAAKILCPPNFTISPAARVTTNAARTTKPQLLAPTANPKPVKSAPATAIPAIICTRVRYSPPGSHIAANSVANAAGRKYCCWSNAVRTTNGTSMPPNTTAPLFRLSPALLSTNSFASRSIGPPSERRQSPTPANGCPHPSWAVAEPTVHRKPSWTQGSARTGRSARLTDRGEQTPIGALNRQGGCKRRRLGVPPLSAPYVASTITCPAALSPARDDGCPPNGMPTIQPPWAAPGTRAGERGVPQP